MIEIKQLNKMYHHAGGQTTALKDISLLVPRGTICGIIGKSGAGKTSLIRCINLLEQPDSGQILMDGVDMTQLNPKQLREKRRKIGKIFQHFNLLSSRTVYENIALALEFAKLDKKTIRSKVEHLLQLTGLEDRADAYPAQLSGGQKQRVAIARALANDPEVLLCDEATSALDPEMTATILDLLKSINQKLQLTIILITHQIEVIKSICDDVAVIDQAQIVEQGSVFDIFTRPQSSITKALISSALKLELPKKVAERLHIAPAADKIPVWRIQFFGKSSTEPVISHMARQYQINFNILQANIEIIQEQTLGVMVVEAMGDEHNLQQSKQYLIEQGLPVEVIGYVASAH